LLCLIKIMASKLNTVPLNGRSLVSAVEAGQHIGVSKFTIQKWAKHGRIGQFNLSSCTVRYDLAEVAALVESSRVTASKEAGR
jgi:hypothetical protein